MLLTYIKSEIQKLMISRAYPPTQMEYALIIVWDSKHEMRISLRPTLTFCFLKAETVLDIIELLFLSPTWSNKKKTQKKKTA